MEMPVLVRVTLDRHQERQFLVRTVQKEYKMLNAPGELHDWCKRQHGGYVLLYGPR